MVARGERRETSRDQPAAPAVAGCGPAHRLLRDGRPGARLHALGRLPAGVRAREGDAAGAVRACRSFGAPDTGGRAARSALRGGAGVAGGCVVDRKSGMRGVLVIDDTARGMGEGGTRMSTGVSVTEVARLARSMTWKWAVTDLFHGGAKAGILGGPADGDREQVLRAPSGGPRPPATPSWAPRSSRSRPPRAPSPGSRRRSARTPGSSSTPQPRARCSHPPDRQARRARVREAMQLRCQIRSER